jgi:hypothetical protein
MQCQLLHTGVPFTYSNISDKADTLGRGIGIGKSSLLLALHAVVFLSVTPVSTELMRGNQLPVSASG